MCWLNTTCENILCSRPNWCICFLVYLGMKIYEFSIFLHSSKKPVGKPLLKKLIIRNVFIYSLPMFLLEWTIFRFVNVFIIIYFSERRKQLNRTYLVGVLYHLRLNKFLFVIMGFTAMNVFFGFNRLLDIVGII